MKSILAVNMDDGTKLVEQFVEQKLVPSLDGAFGALKEFFTGSPSTEIVCDYKGNQWIDGLWGAYILCHSFSSETLYEITHLSDTIRVEEVDIYPTKDGLIEVRCFIAGRIEE
jgi:hypothetical protein